VRLWLDAIRFTGRSEEDFMRSYVGPDEELEKFDVPLGEGQAVEEDVPLAAVYLLQQGDQLEIEPLQGIAAAQAVFENTYRGSFLSAASARQSHWESALRLVQTTKVFSAVREWSLDKLPVQCAVFLAHARSVVS
jgi:hypothetical protein